jgi:hypothetical protein
MLLIDAAHPCDMIPYLVREQHHFRCIEVPSVAGRSNTLPFRNHDGQLERFNQAEAEDCLSFFESHFYFEEVQLYELQVERYDLRQSFQYDWALSKDSEPMAIANYHSKRLTNLFNFWIRLKLRPKPCTCNSCCNNTCCE